MEEKKSPKANLENKKLTYVLMGLVVVLGVIYAAFEWTEKDIKVAKIENTQSVNDEEDLIQQTVQDQTPPPPPVKPPEVIEQIEVVDNNTKTDEIKINSEDDANKAQNVIAAPVAPPADPTEADDYVFKVVEHMPEFPGGMSALMQYLSKNTHYPVVASENGIQGRVICQFTVFKDGHVGDVEVLKSVDPSLDKEAVRVISTMPKWKPGEQRGKKVNCKYTVPVSFRLQ